MQAEVMKSLNLAVAVFLNGEAALARRLVARKMLISEMENRAADHSFQHVRERRGEDGSADDYHLRIYAISNEFTRWSRRLHIRSGPRRPTTEQSRPDA